MKTSLGIVMAVLLPALLTCRAADPPEPQKPSFWMQKKLEYSEKILNGLVQEDFDAIGKAARSMNSLGQMEKWARASMPAYRAQLHIFQDANEQLIRSSDQKNLPAAALAYVQLTMGCINCHKIVRDADPKKPADSPDKK